MAPNGENASRSWCDSTSWLRSPMNTWKCSENNNGHSVNFQRISSADHYSSAQAYFFQSGPHCLQSGPDTYNPRTRSSATAETVCNVDDAIQGHSRSSVGCANWRGIYDFLLALNSNLTSIFNRSWDIMPSLHIHTPPLLQMELEKDGLG